MHEFEASGPKGMTRFKDNKYLFFLVWVCSKTPGQLHGLPLLVFPYADVEVHHWWPNLLTSIHQNLGLALLAPRLPPHQPTCRAPMPLVGVPKDRDQEAGYLKGWEG